MSGFISPFMPGFNNPFLGAPSDYLDQIQQQLADARQTNEAHHERTDGMIDDVAGLSKKVHGLATEFHEYRDVVVDRKIDAAKGEIIGQLGEFGKRLRQEVKTDIENGLTDKVAARIKEPLEGAISENKEAANKNQQTVAVVQTKLESTNKLLWWIMGLIAALGGGVILAILTKAIG